MIIYEKDVNELLRTKNLFDYHFLIELNDRCEFVFSHRITVTSMVLYLELSSQSSSCLTQYHCLVVQELKKCPIGGIMHLMMIFQLFQSMKTLHLVCRVSSSISISTLTNLIAFKTSKTHCSSP
jgi:hypothetical protein